MAGAKIQQNRLEHAFDLAMEAFTLAGIQFDRLEDSRHTIWGQGESVDITAFLDDVYMSGVRVSIWPMRRYEVAFLYDCPRMGCGVGTFSGADAHTDEQGRICCPRCHAPVASVSEEA